MTPFESGDHTRHSAIWLMWWPRKFIVLIKMGKLVAAAGWEETGRGTQSDLASAASLVSGIQEVVSNKSGDHSHNINVNWYWQEIQDRLYQIVLFIFLEFSKERLWTYVFLWRWATFFGESIFVENKERVCCPEQNAKSKSVLRLDFLMCGDEREGEEG